MQQKHPLPARPHRAQHSDKTTEMTTTQLAKRLEISQPRIVAMEKNERNVKISTMERIADTLNCDFSYAFVPRENIDDIIYNQAKKKAQKILDKVNKNMGLENQLAKTDDLLKDIIEELLDPIASLLTEMYLNGEISKDRKALEDRIIKGDLMDRVKVKK